MVGVRVVECPVLNGLMKVGTLPFTHLSNHLSTHHPSMHSWIHSNHLSTHSPIHAFMDPFTHLPT